MELRLVDFVFFWKSVTILEVENACSQILPFMELLPEYLKMVSSDLHGSFFIFDFFSKFGFTTLIRKVSLSRGFKFFCIVSFVKTKFCNWSSTFDPFFRSGIYRLKIMYIENFFKPLEWQLLSKFWKKFRIVCSKTSATLKVPKIFSLSFSNQIIAWTKTYIGPTKFQRFAGFFGT